MADINILKTANEIVNERSEEKSREYGDFSECMEKTALIASIMSNKKITPEDAYNVLIAVKLAREGHAHKTDNLLDAVAYIGALNNYINNKKQTK
jgi:DNA-binding protein H-NS